MTSRVVGTMINHVAGLFTNRIDVEKTLNDLRDIGIRDERISIIVNEDTRGRTFVMDENTKAPEGIAIGGVAGAAIGGIVAALATAGVVVVTGGLGLILVGPVVGALAGIGTGAIAGGLVGGLVGLGFDEHEATYYDEAIRKGKILMILENMTSDDLKHSKDIIKKHGGHLK